MYVMRSPMAGFRHVNLPRPESELVTHTAAGSSARAAAAIPGRVRTLVATVSYRSTFVAVTAYSSDGCLKIFDKGWRIWVPLRERVSREGPGNAKH